MVAASQRFRGALAPVTAATVLLAGMLSAQETYKKEISRSSEKEVQVNVELAFGTLELGRTHKDVIVEVRYDGPTLESEDFSVEYNVEHDRGTFQLRARKESFWGSSGDHDGEERHWTLLLTDRLPLTLDIEFGAGEGEIDLTGLRVEDLRLSSGASSVDLTCDAVNAVRAQKVSIESGVGKLTAEGLANLNFKKLSFSGGVGSYKLDFGGALKEDGEVDVEVGLGAVALVIPRELPTRLTYEKNWLSSFTLDDAFVKVHRDTYETDDYAGAAKKLTVRVESGLGSVSVRIR